MSKKADLSMNIIIVAAIALLVLVVLSVIFIGRMGAFGEETGACGSQGGTCYDGSSCPQGTATRNLKCADNQVCCISVGL